MKMDNIEIEIETGVDKSLGKINSFINTLKSLETVSDKTADSMKKVADNITPITNKMSNATKSVNDFKNNMGIVDKIKANPELNVNEFIKNKDDAVKAIKELRQAQDDLRKGGKVSFNSDAFKEYDTYGRSISKLMGKFKLTPDSVGFNKSTKEMSAGLKQVEKDMRSAQGETARTRKSLKSMSSIGKDIKGMFSKTFGVFGTIGKKFSNTTETMLHKLKKLGLGLLAVRTTMSLLTKAVRAYMNFDGELQDSISNSWNMLGALLAPAIERVADLFATATAYVYTFVKALTGIDLVARANAKALATQAAKTKAAAQAQRSLSSMDEITNLPTEPSGGTAPQIEVPEIKADTIFSDIINAIKAGNWYEAGNIIADGINTALGNIPWGRIKSNASKFGKGLADFLNGIVDNVDWKLIGSTIGNGLQTAINFAYELFTNFHWIQFGAGLGEGLMSAFNSIDWAKLGKTIHNLIAGIINAITYFIKTADWKKIGQGFREFLDNLDLSDLIARFYEMIKEALGGFGDFIAGLLDLDTGTAKTVAGVLVGIITSLFIIKKLIGFFNKFKKAKDGVKEAASEIGKGFGDMLKSIGKAASAIAILGGLALVINSLSKFIKSFGDSGMKVSDGLILLGGTLAMIAGSFILLSKTAESLPITALLGVVAVLGMLTLTLNAVSNLFKTFAKNSLDMGSAIGLLITVFAGIIVLMTAVAVLGPMMTAGLIPFAVIMGIIIATLFVLQATLPTILEAVGNFIETVAPPLSEVIDTIFKGITSIVNVLGKTLPPIVKSIGTVFKTVFDGIAAVVKSVGDVIVGIMKAAQGLIDGVLKSILNFINKLGPAINNLVDGIIRAITKVVNFIVSAIEYLINTVIVGPINAVLGTVGGLTKMIGIKIGKMDKVKIARFAPKLETGTNEIITEGIYHLHEGEAVVPKKYNPATGGYDNSADNKQIIDLLVNLNANMLALSEREMAVYMDGRKVAEGIYDDTREIERNKNVSTVMQRS